jgi:flagellin
LPFTINTNVASLQDQNYLNGTQALQQKSIFRLSSGLRINNSGDDAAGLSIANSFRSDEAVLTQGVRNANDGLSQLQIADGGLNNISQLLDRARSLATQSASGTFTGDRGILNAEFQSVLSEIDRQSQSIGLNTGGTFATSLSVFIGGGTASNGINAITNGSVTFDLTKSTVDSKSLGLKGVQSIGIAGTDIGPGSSSTSVATILANTTNTNSEGVAGTTQFLIAGPGFSGANEIAVNVNLTSAVDANTLAAAVNQAITNAGNGGTQAATAFKNANITAAVNTDSSGKQQLTFNSSGAAFQVEAGDRVANAFLGNFTSGAIGKDLTNVVTGTGVTVAGSLTQNVIIRIQGSGLASPVDLQVANATTSANALTTLSSLVANNGALQAAGITLSGTSAVGSTLTFTTKRGESFNVSTAGDTGNLLGLGTYSNATAGGTAFDYTSITGAGATFAAAAQTLEFSIAGGPAISGALTPTAATQAGAISALNTFFAQNASLAAAGLNATVSGGQIQIASTNGTAFRINALGAANVFGFGSGGVAGSPTIAAVANDNTNNVHYDSGGASATNTFQYTPLLNGQDAQTITFSANDATGAAHTTQVVLQNNGTTRNARSLDEAINTINTQLQQTNDATLQKIAAVKEYIDATHEGIRFVSTLGSFDATLSATGTGGAAGIGVAADQGKVQSSAVTAGGGSADISNVSTASAAVTALSTSISILGKSQAVIGRSQNQLNFAIALAQSQLINKTAAESRIRDADLAAESANLTKANILLQAGVAALAQANSSPQQVLQLLRF